MMVSGHARPASGAGIVFDGLTKRYGATAALDDFSLEIHAGEFMTLLGPSGSGKTTALNALAGFVPPDSGRILVGQQSILELPPEQRQLGMVFQSYTLFPHMNVYDNVAFPLRLRKTPASETKRKVEEVLGMVQLSDLAGRMPRELSGGQQQRVAFARAVVFEPPVLLMDEPLSALDLKLRQAMQLEIRQYHAALGCTIIFVTHDQEEALVLSDRVAVMNNGRICQVDTPDRIYDHPNSRYVAEFIGKTNIFQIETGTNGQAHVRETGSAVPAIAAGSTDARWLSVRPEKISRTQGHTDDAVAFSGTVCEVLFLGNLIQYGVRTPGGTVVLVQEHRASNAAPPAMHDQIDLQFRFSDALAVRD